MRLLRRALLGLVLLAVLAAGVGLYFVANPNLPDYQPPARLNYLDQWSEADRQIYYYTPQGTQVGWSTTGSVRWSFPSAVKSSPRPTTSPASAFWSIPRNKPPR